jgi:aryl-alcohol dehydrogenase-like predicted oxidoreductase
MLPSLRVPHTEFSLSRIGFGCEQLGMYNWGDLDISKLNFAVNEAIDYGVDYFDTADVYGLGKSEENLSIFLGSRRKEIKIITKFGIRFHGSERFFDNSNEWINSAIEFSLKRLKTDYIDLYQLHYWDNKTNLNDVVTSLIKLKEQGKIRAFGFSNVPLDNTSSLLNYSSIFSYEYSLAEKRHENYISNLNMDMLFLAYGGLGQGILSGKYSKTTIFSENDKRSSNRYVNFHGDRLIKNLEIVDNLKNLATKYNVPISAVALRYIIEFIPKSSIICGIKDSKQLYENLEVFNFSLNSNEIQQLTNISNEESILPRAK